MDQIDEYEQGERVRAWLKDNGTSLITGIALGLAGLGGWQWWQNQGEVAKVQAAAEYRAFTRAAEAGQVEKANAHAQAVRQNHPDTPYVALVALEQAQQLQGEGKAEEAIAALEGVDTEGMDPAMAQLLQLRVMRLLAGEGRHQDVLDRLAKHPLELYPGVANELRGDAELALGNREQARQAYEAALAALDVASPTRGIVEMKFAAAGGRPPETPEA